MNLRQLKITSRNGIGQESRVELDDEDISNSLLGVTLHVHADEYVTATLELGVLGGSFDGQAQVVLREETQVLLKQLGWTPPAEFA